MAQERGGRPTRERIRQPVDERSRHAARATNRASRRRHRRRRGRRDDLAAVVEDPVGPPHDASDQRPGVTSSPVSSYISRPERGGVVLARLDAAARHRPQPRPGSFARCTSSSRPASSWRAHPRSVFRHCASWTTVGPRVRDTLILAAALRYSERRLSYRSRETVVVMNGKRILGMLVIVLLVFFVTSHRNGGDVGAEHRDLVGGSRQSMTIRDQLWCNRCWRPARSTSTCCPPSGGSSGCACTGRSWPSNLFLTGLFLLLLIVAQH